MAKIISVIIILLLMCLIVSCAFESYSVKITYKNGTEKIFDNVVGTRLPIFQGALILDRSEGGRVIISRDRVLSCERVDSTGD